MIYCTQLLVQILLVRVLSRPEKIFNEVQVTEQMKMNIKTVVSVVYEIVMIFLRT